MWGTKVCRMVLPGELVTDKKWGRPMVRRDASLPERSGRWLFFLPHPPTSPHPPLLNSRSYHLNSTPNNSTHARGFTLTCPLELDSMGAWFGQSFGDGELPSDASLATRARHGHSGVVARGDWSGSGHFNSDAPEFLHALLMIKDQVCMLAWPFKTIGAAGSHVKSFLMGVV